MKIKKKMMLALLCILIVLPATITTSFASSYTEIKPTQEKRIVIATLYYSKSQVKDIRNSMNNAKIVDNILVGVVSSFIAKNPYVGFGLGAASSIRQNSSFAEAVNKAYYQGKGLKVTITDYANYHTSYSIQYNCTVY